MKRKRLNQLKHFLFLPSFSQLDAHLEDSMAGQAHSHVRNNTDYALTKAWYALQYHVSTPKTHTFIITCIYLLWTTKFNPCLNDIIISPTSGWTYFRSEVLPEPV